MADDPHSTKNWFEQGGQAYAQFRPEYPTELSAYLAQVAPDRHMAVDVGCGTGQLTQQLAAHFDRVVGLDPSASQIANTQSTENLDFVLAPAEHLPLPDNCASLVTAAQAAHWFDLPRFYDEARRTAIDCGVIALVSYGVLKLERPDLDARFRRFYGPEIGAYWPPERQMVDNGYRDVPFPFNEWQAPSFSIECHWALDELLGYISTWSAVRAVTEAGCSDLLDAFAREMQSLWGDGAIPQEVTWPVILRIGTV